MKLLMIYCEKFGYKTSMKTLEEVADQTGEKQIFDAVVGFINMEAEDEGRTAKIETKMIKNLKWAANKNDSKTIVLHSFAHLSESKAEPAKVAELLDNAQARLKSSGYQVFQTPFGYFLDLDIKAPGNPLTRLFKSF